MNILKTILLILIAAVLCTSCTDKGNEEHTSDSISINQNHTDPLSGLNTSDQKIFLATYSSEQILNSLSYNKDSIRRTNHDITEWKHLDSSILVLNQIEFTGRDRKRAFEICLLKKQKGALQLIAKGIIADNSEDEDYFLMNTQFDRGTYKISENEYAIAVTGTPLWYYNGPNYYNYGHNLILFRIQGNTISPMVMVPLLYTHGDRHEENDSTIVLDSETSDSSAIVFLTTKADTYFDFVLKTTNTSIRGESETPVVTRSSTLYRWKNDRYSTSEEGSE